MIFQPGEFQLEITVLVFYIDDDKIVRLLSARLFQPERLPIKAQGSFQIADVVIFVYRFEPHCLILRFYT